MLWSFLYLAAVLAVNIAFAWRPDLAPLWSIGVGGVFVARDLAQRQIGHWVVIPMGVALALSYWLASPFVALASATAFAFSEAVDWLVFSLTRRPLRDRILWSCGLAAPVDSLIFLGMIGALGPFAFGAQVASKWLAAALVWAALRWRDGRVRK